MLLTSSRIVQVKPDGVQRGLVGEIISRFEKKGFTLRGLKLFVPGKELAEEHYKDLASKPFFPALVEYITSGPVVAMVRLPCRLASDAPYHTCSLTSGWAAGMCQDIRACCLCPFVALVHV